MEPLKAPPASAETWQDALPQAVVLFEAGRVTHLNAAAARLWGVSSQKAAGRPLLEVLRRHTLEALAERGGELELDVSGRTLRCVALPGALIVEDVTDHRRREAELREATAILSHEFRTPVTGLRGVLEALEYAMPAELQQHFVKQGLQEVERLARLVEDLAVGFRPTRARTVPISEVLARAERLLSHDLSARAAQLRFADDHLVRADPDKLLQIFLNLIENALKYGPSGAAVEIRAVPNGAWIEVAVHSEGEALGSAERLFEAHTRGEDAPGLGSGMGLYIVRSLVQGWGGKAWAERRGQRNAFVFTLPGVAGLT